MEVMVHQEDSHNSPENSDESPRSPLVHDTKPTSTSSPRKSRRGTQKRVVHVPLKEVDGSRLKAETNSPPADSWAWRKYGQKPIKGSPYPRGYYRCSSSKGCPARKQVERSRADPTMVIVTYSCDHNHPWPASKNNNNHHPPPSPSPSPSPPATSPEPTTINNDHDQSEEEPPTQTNHSEPEFEPQHHPDSEQKFMSLDVGSCGTFATSVDQYAVWFSDWDSTSSTMLESPLTMARDMAEDNEIATIFSIRDDEESFFADLGELPECTAVFRRREKERVEEHCRSLAPCCGTTG